MITEIGPVELDVPRDREGSFNPQTVRKSQRRLEVVDSMVISLTAKGLTARAVDSYLAEVYGTPIARDDLEDHRPGAWRTCWMADSAARPRA